MTARVPSMPMDSDINDDASQPVSRDLSRGLSVQEILEIAAPEAAEAMIGQILVLNQSLRTNQLEHLPDADTIFRNLKGHGWSRVQCDCLLDVLSRLSLIIVLEGPGTRKSYLANKPGNLRTILPLITDRMQRLFIELEGRSLPLAEIVAMFHRGYRRPGLGEKAEVLRAYMQAHVAISDAIEAKPVHNLRVEAEASVLWKEIIAHAQAAPEPEPPPAPSPARRAVDEPRWTHFEEAHGPDIPWVSVVQKFGAEMMIRIVLRREDYGPLLTLLREFGGISAKDLQYASQSLAKIEAHSAVTPEKRQDFNDLRNYLQSLGY